MTLCSTVLWWTDLCGKVMSSGQVFKPEQTVPVACSPSAGIMLYDLMYRQLNCYRHRVLLKSDIAREFENNCPKIPPPPQPPHLYLPEGFAASC